MDAPRYPPEVQDRQAAAFSWAAAAQELWSSCRSGTILARVTALGRRTITIADSAEHEEITRE